METENKDTQVVDKVEKETTQKTYTGEELKAKIDESFNAGVRKANTDWQKDENYKKFLDWKKEHQNDSDKIAELEGSNANKDKEIALLKAQLEVKDSDVKKEFSKFVTSEVMALVNDDVTLEQALKSYKKDFPQYFGETVVTKVQTSPKLGGGDKPTTTNDIMNDFIRNK